MAGLGPARRRRRPTGKGGKKEEVQVYVEMMEIGIAEVGSWKARSG